MIPNINSSLLPVVLVCCHGWRGVLDAALQDQVPVPSAAAAAIGSRGSQLSLGAWRKAPALRLHITHTFSCFTVSFLSFFFFHCLSKNISICICFYGEEASVHHLGLNSNVTSTERTSCSKSISSWSVFLFIVYPIEKIHFFSVYLTIWIYLVFSLCIIIFPSKSHASGQREGDLSLLFTTEFNIGQARLSFCCSNVIPQTAWLT